MIDRGDAPGYKGRILSHGSLIGSVTIHSDELRDELDVLRPLHMYRIFEKVMLSDWGGGG